MAAELPYHKRTTMNDENKHAELAREVSLVLSAWDINPSQQTSLLGLTEEEGRSQLLVLLSQNNEVLTRAATLVAIDRNVCLALPHAPELARLWITTPTPLLDGKTPLEWMLIEGLAGITHVRSLLNGSEFW